MSVLLCDTYTNALVNPRYSAISKHLQTQHDNKRAKIDHLFKALKKYRSKFDCLIYKMLFIKDNQALSQHPKWLNPRQTIHLTLSFLFFYCLFCLTFAYFSHRTHKYFYCFTFYIFSFELLPSWLDNGVE